MPTTVTVLTNGPLLLKREHEVKDGQGNPLPAKDETSLCRCGASGDTPCCDGSQKKVSFKG